MHDTSGMMEALHNSEFIGFVAGFGTTFAAVPDLMRMLKRRSSKGMNPTMPAIMAVFQVVWIYYGVLIESRPVVWWNIVAVAINSLSVTAYVLFSRRDSNPALK
jgi:MtN3 and saliva related transmembrane protein